MHEDAFQVLVKVGASTTVTDKDGKTPFDVICSEDWVLCSKWTQTTLEKLLRP